MNFSLVISNNKRSLTYLSELVKNKFYPKNIAYIIQKNNKNIYNKKILKIIYENNLLFKIFKSNTINTPDIKKYILKELKNIIIYSGISGDIIKDKNLLIKKKFIHSHSGKLPEYRGSTTIYYSYLIEKKIYCSTIILNNKIDNGLILYLKKYSIPEKVSKIESDYDNLIRIKNIIYCLKNYKKLIIKKQKKIYKNNFYIMHPVLRAITLSLK